MTFQSARAISLGVALATVITQGRFIAIGANGLIVHPGAGADAVGVALEGSTALQDVAVPVAVLDGSVLEIEAGAAVVAGTAVGSDASGRAVTVTALGDKVLGYAVDAAGAAGEFIRVVASKGGFAAQA